MGAISLFIVYKTSLGKVFVWTWGGEYDDARLRERHMDDGATYWSRLL